MAKPKRPLWLTVTMVACGVIIGMSVLVVYLADPTSFAWLHEIELLGSLAVGFFLSIALHEFGHAAAGWLAGMRLIAIRVGPLMLSRWHSSYRLGWIKKGFFSGGTLMVPRSPAQLRTRYFAFVVGGPIAGVLVFTGLVVFGIPSSQNPDVQLWFAFTALFTALSILLSVLPIRSRIPSDGARIIDLLRHAPRQEADLRRLTIAGISASGVRPRDWDVDLVASIEADEDVEATGSLISYYAASDRGDAARVEQAIQRLEIRAAQDGAPISALALYEIASYDCTARGDAAAARLMISKVGEDDCHPHTRLRTEAAIALTEHRFHEAKELAARALTSLTGCFDRGFEPIERQWIEKIMIAATESQITASAAAEPNPA